MRERNKKCRKTPGNLENEPTLLLFAFFSYTRGSSLSSFFCSRLLSSSEVLPFLLKAKQRVFCCFVASLLFADIKTPRFFCCNTIIMGVLRVKGKDLIAFRR